MTFTVSNGPRPESAPPRKKRAVIFAGTLVGALAVAFATGLGGSLATRTNEALSSEKPIVTASAVEGIYECGTQLFVSGPQAAKIATGQLPSPEWSEFKPRYDARQAGRAVVQISILGEGERTVTLTGVKFRVKRQDQPAEGATFAHSCGDGTYGRSLLVNLDKDPPVIEATNADIDGQLEVSTRPIRFPWTVDVKDTLLLFVVGTSQSCYCRFEVEIPWQSGGKSGVLKLNNEGRGFGIAPLGDLTYDGKWQTRAGT